MKIFKFFKCLKKGHNWELEQKVIFKSENLFTETRYFWKCLDCGAIRDFKGIGFMNK